MGEPRPCRACGMPIQMIDGPNGKRIPAQRVRSVYVLLESEYDPPALEKLERAEIESVVGAPVPVFYVSHFETCPRASDFHRKD